MQKLYLLSSRACSLLMKVDTFINIIIQFDKACTGANQRMCGDKGQGHSPRLGGETGNAQLPEKGTFK